MGLEVSDDVAVFLKWFSGEEFPGTDEDKLRAIALAHIDAADGIDEVLPLLVVGVNAIKEGVQGQAERAFVESTQDYVAPKGYVGQGSRYVHRMGETLEASATQAQYTKIVIFLTVIELMFEFTVVLALTWVYPGLLTKFLMRLLVERLGIWKWLARLLIAITFAQVIGVGMQVLISFIAQAIQIKMGTREGWDLSLFEDAAEVGSWIGAVGTMLGPVFGLLGGAFIGAAGKYTFGDFVREVFTEGVVGVVGEGSFGLMKGNGWSWSNVPLVFVSEALSGAAEGAGAGVGGA